MSEQFDPGRALGESDWDDEDLLTISEASERLAGEIRLARERGETDRARELIAAAERIALFSADGSSQHAAGEVQQ